MRHVLSDKVRPTSSLKEMFSGNLNVIKRNGRRLHSYLLFQENNPLIYLSNIITWTINHSSIMATDSKPAATIQSLDHLVLTVKSIEKTIEWYTSNLGMETQSFESMANPGVKRCSLIFGHQKINLHQLGKVSWIFFIEISIKPNSLSSPSFHNLSLPDSIHSRCL